MRRFSPLFLSLVLLAMASVAWAQQPSTAASPKPSDATNTPDVSSPATASQPETSAASATPKSEEPANAESNVDKSGPPSEGVHMDPNDPLFGVPPLPKGKTSMVGGYLEKIDKVHNRLTLKVFGAGKMTVNFDERSHFFRDGVEVTQEKIKKGDRIYVDTMTDGPRVLARNVRVVTNSSAADARGQIVSASAGSITMRDQLSAQPVQFSVTSATKVTRQGQPGSISDLQPGSLVAVTFSPDRANRGVAQEVSILAAPGANFTFVGRVTHLDMRVGQFSVDNKADDKTYDIAFNTASMPKSLMVGSDVVVVAVFDGRHYTANNITVTGTTESASTPR